MASPDKPLSGRAKSHLAVAAMALASIVVIASSLTHEKPHLVEDEGEYGIATEIPMQKDYLLEDLDRDTSNVRIMGSDEDDILLEPLQEQWTEDPELNKGALTKLGKTLTKLTVVQNSMLQGPATATPAPGSAAPKTKTAPEAKGASQAGGGSESPAVEKALKDAAEAKIQALAAQQKALVAGTEAKSAAAQAAQAPMTQAGQEVVKNAQQKVAAAKLDVDTAKAAMDKMNRLKTKASQVIIDAAGGKFAKQTGYVGQGGYFGTALRTAFKNGELTERMKHAKWKEKTLAGLKKKAFQQGKQQGEAEGEKKGIKMGEKKELPKAVAKAEKLLAQKKQEQNNAKVAGKKAAEDAALKSAAQKEAAKVSASVKEEANAKEGETKPTKSKTSGLLESDFEDEEHPALGHF